MIVEYGNGKEKITNAKIIEAISANEIKIGDTVYTVNCDPYGLTAEVRRDVLRSGNGAAFHPSGQMCVLYGGGRTIVYSVQGNVLTALYNLPGDSENNVLTKYSSCQVFSSDGRMLVVCGGYLDDNNRSRGYAKVYAVDGMNITYVSDIDAGNGTAVFNDYVTVCTFSPDGKVMILGGEFNNYVNVYSVEGTNITFVKKFSGLYKTSGYVNTCSFSPDGTMLVVGGAITDGAKLYSVNGTDITFISNPFVDADGTALSFCRCGTFSPDGTLYLLGTSEGVRIYEVDGTQFTYCSNLPFDNNVISNMMNVDVLRFSPNGKMLMVGNNISSDSHMMWYMVDGTSFTVGGYINDFENDTLGQIIDSITFSSDGDKILVLGAFNGGARLYTLEENTLIYHSDLMSAETTLLSSSTYNGAFSPDKKLFVICGGFTGYAKLYSVHDNHFTYIRDIYADNNQTPLDDMAYICRFSPDGRLLVVGGSFTGYAKLYMVDDTTLTYISDICADNEGTPLNAWAHRCVFTPDGTKMILLGGFNGRIKLYAVSGTTLTHINNAPTDSNGTVFGNTALNSCSLSPDGQLFVVGGYLSQGAKLYTVNDSGLSFVSNISTNDEGASSSTFVYGCNFSPNGKLLVLGGTFTGGVRIYSVNGTNITYASTPVADAAGTSLGTKVGAGECVFTSDGKIAILGGNYWSGSDKKLKRYAINGSNFTYLDDLDIISSPHFLLANDSMLIARNTVYTLSEQGCVSGDQAYSALDGKLFNLPPSIKIGFAKSSANVGSPVKVKIIGSIDRTI